ncbi:hypothetical protein QYF36_015353 [Acer negundo]|nr:hypothetical protein QYF36_015353 [Acer negundo]
MFTFHFKDKNDLDRVISEGSWSFDNGHITMEKLVRMDTIDSQRFSQADFWSFTIQSTPQVSQAQATWIEDEAHNSPTKGSDPIVSNPLSGPVRDLREEKSNNKSIESISLSDGPAFAFGPNFKTCQVLRGKKGSRTTRIRDLGISTECSKILCGKRKVDPKEKEKSYGRRKARKVVGVYKIEGDISKKNSEGNSGEEVTKIMVSPTEYEDLESTLSAGRSSLARCSQ